MAHFARANNDVTTASAITDGAVPFVRFDCSPRDCSRSVIGCVVGQHHDCEAGADALLGRALRPIHSVMNEFVCVVSVCNDYEFNDNYEVIGDAVTS